MGLTKNEQKALRWIFTDYVTDYNAFNLKDKLGLSDVGSLKLLKRMKDKNWLTSKKMGNATFYKINTNDSYVIKLLELIFFDNSSLTAFARGWMLDLRQFEKDALAVLLFGSVLVKGKQANDIDVCFILRDHDDYAEVQAKVNKLNAESRQKIHPLYLSEDDFRQKLLEHDVVVIDMIRSCAVVFGQELFIRVINDVQSREKG